VYILATIFTILSLLEFSLLLLLILITWPYLGYPLFLLILSKIFKKEHYLDESYYPIVSLIIPTYNEEACIEEKIVNSLSLDYPKDKLEIIVVDSGSTDRTREIIKKYSKNGVILYEQQKRMGKASAINLGLKRAKGEIIIVTDANAIFHNDVIKKIVRHFADKNVGGVEGKYILKTKKKTDVGEGEKTFRKFESFLKKYESLVDSTVSMVGEISAFRRDIIDSLDGSCIAEDFDLSIRVRKKGYRLIHDPEAIVWEPAPANIKDEIIQKSRRIVGTIQVLFKHKDVLFNPKYGVYGCFILPSHKFLPILSPFLNILFVILFVLHLFLTRKISLYLFILISSFTYVSSVFTYNIYLSLILLTFLFLVCLIFISKLFHLVKYFLVLQYTFLIAWVRYVQNKYTVTWEKIDSSRTIKEIISEN